MKLAISPTLGLPLDVVTEKVAFIGRTGTGKTYAAMKLAELMLEADAQIVALDAVGAWYGLRVAGSGDAFPVPVFGGLNGDFPLESTGGRFAADLLVDRSISAVLDVSQFTHGEQVRFALDFATQFFQRKKSSPSAVHVFLEECQEFVPQNPMPGEQAMLAAFERLWKLGRNFGIGGSLISQRPQEINKKSLNQTGTLFVFQMTGPQERKAIEAWVGAQGIDEDIGDVLPKLRQGEPHVWSPTFLNVSKTVRIGEKRTADVSSTPKVGSRKRERPLTAIDAPDIAARMQETIERAKADDPKALRAKVKDLERALAKAGEADAKVERVEVPVLTHDERLGLQTLSSEIGRHLAEVGKCLGGSEKIIERIQGVLSARRDSPDRNRVEISFAKEETYGVRPPRRVEAGREITGRRTTNADGLPRGARAMLAALMAFPDRALSKPQVATLSGLGVKGGTWAKYLSILRTAEMVEDGDGGSLRLTPAGSRVAIAVDAPRSEEDVVRLWAPHLPAGARAMWAAVLDHKRLSRDRLGALVNIEPSGGTFAKYLSILCSNGLVGREDGHLVPGPAMELVS